MYNNHQLIFCPWYSQSNLHWCRRAFLVLSMFFML